jgi:hypothetical protein
MGRSKNQDERREQWRRLKNSPEKTGVQDAGRRRIILAGAGGLGAVAVAALAGYKAGWFGGGSQTSVKPTATATPIPLPPVKLSADRANAIRATTEIVSHYTREIQNASSGIHALRGLGRTFTMKDGTRITDFLCTRFATEKVVNGQRYVYFPREHEVHDNSFLKTFLEAGVGPDQIISVAGNRYTLNDLVSSSKALFRFDPADIRRFDPEFPEDHLPWGLIAFSRVAPPDNPTWVNAYGEKIDMNQVVDLGLADFESVCARIGAPGSTPTGLPLNFREVITKYSCYGMHAFYGFFSAYRNGYRVNDYEKRTRRLVEHLILRLERDLISLEEEMAAAKQFGQEYIARMGAAADSRRRGSSPPPPELIEVMGLKNFIVTFGHALESLNFVRLHQLFPLSPGQIREIERQESRLFEGLVKLRSFNLDAFLKWDPKFVNDLVIAEGHALRAIKLLGPDNPDQEV